MKNKLTIALEAIAVKENLSLSKVCEKLGFHCSFYSNTKRIKANKPTVRLQTALKPYAGLYEVQDYLSEATLAYTASYRRRNQITLHDLPTFCNFCFHVTASVRPVIHAIIQLTAAEPELLLQEFRITISGAEEYNAVESFINELITVYTDHGHKVDLRILIG